MTEEFDVRLPIQLGQFVKLAGLTETGGQAREVIQEGFVRVNGQVNTHRSAKLNDGDLVEVAYPGGPRMRARVCQA
ncbi:RNA-binding S4 domain-containing protein [Arcanobacterium buesumense]|uniref:RNA-binding S4 domain-containing protein n=1 Tax=Arcanobacterium buesumense TaxID=2722751 RepID=A0A6H2ELA2_9ACTO|nr:RNA-binding S4 domain-containing protein [Arcanobacterium buesumense]QJC21622.1 RNA-binding S4 domain-containing protein [Arcanobacterium buesumense]